MLDNNNTLITEVDILDEAKENFLVYAEEVLTDRAIPAAEDGLLSVHRKILWTIEDVLKLTNKSKFKKSASIVGSTLASAYFHSDSSCYGALCKMAQPYLNRYPLVEGDGNLGTQEGNGMEAASRYTNSRPSKYADLMFNDFKKNVVPMKETYNGEYYEPVVLPAGFPNALVNGREAIGISLAHNSMPNNLSEVCEGIMAYLDNENITLDEMMKYIPGPDFPLGGVVINKSAIKEAYRTGHSAVSLKVRGDYEVSGQTITFTTIPYRTYRNKIKEQITKNVDELDKYIEDFHDLSNVGKNKLVFKVRKDVNPEAAVLKLFELTDLQTSLSYNMNFIVNGTPKLCSLIDLIKAYVVHQEEILICAANYDMEKALARIHILEGLLKAVDKINEVIELIKGSKDKSEANLKLRDFLIIDSTQAEAILDMKLARLTKINKQELVDELKEKRDLVEDCKRIIGEKLYRFQILKEKVLALKKDYGDARRTKLEELAVAKEEKEVAEIIPEDVVVTITRSGAAKRVPAKNYRIQNVRGKGAKNSSETALSIISTNTIDYLLLFTNEGKMYRVAVDSIPVGTNATKEVPFSSFSQIPASERVVAATSANRENNPKYVVFFTKNGLMKKTMLDEYAKTKKSTGIQAIKLAENDSIANVVLMDEEEVIVLTKKGMGIRYGTQSVAAIGRLTLGVKSIKLDEGDSVIAGLPIMRQDSYVAILNEDGCGKKIKVDEFSYQNRGGKGVIASPKNIADAALIEDSDSVLIGGISSSICITTADIPTLNRPSIGNVLIKSRAVNITKI